MVASPRVLLVEDDSAYAEAVAYAFEEFAPTYTVDITSTLAAALAAVAQASYDVVLLDLRLPDAMDLAGLYTFVHAVPGLTHLVVLTAYRDYQEEVEALGVTYLNKNDAIGRDLVARVQHLVDAARAS